MYCDDVTGEPLAILTVIITVPTSLTTHEEPDIILRTLNHYAVQLSSILIGILNAILPFFMAEVILQHIHI